MRAMLLGCAAGLAAFTVTVPATAGSSDHRSKSGTVTGGQFPPGFTGGGLNVRVGKPGFGHHSGGGGGGDHHGGGGGEHHGGDSDDLGIWVNSGQFALYNNRTFEADSFNGWWHDRPDRAYPAWVRNNQDCARKWYAGNTLRC